MFVKTTFDQSYEEGWSFVRKNIFFKYLLTFLMVIALSFFVLTFIFTTMIREYSASDTDNRLLESTAAIAEHIEQCDVNTMQAYIDQIWISGSVFPIVSVYREIGILLCDAEGNILLRADSADAYQTADIKGSVDISKLKPISDPQRHIYFYGAPVDSGAAQRTYATAVYQNDDCIGYVVGVRSTAVEDAVVGAVRRATFTSTVWVVLAAVIAVYFITERMMRPLREITHAAKVYAKGDFSIRVQIFGDDEIAELGRSFNHMATELEKLDVMRNSFLANISHDLRTPMTTIAGFIDGINSGAIPQEKHAHYLSIISLEVHRLSRLVTELLDISRIESGERKFVFSDFNMAEMARIILISFEQRIEEKQLDVVFDSDDCVPVFADKDAIHQVMYNLCHNAIKFANVGGLLRIGIEQSTDDHTVTVCVFDEGQSIPAEDIPYIFDRFYKTDKSRGLDKSGVGLGLYICKTVMDAHKERISVQMTNRNGKDGCEFTFTLKQGTAPTRKPLSSADEENGYLL